MARTARVGAVRNLKTLARLSEGLVELLLPRSHNLHDLEGWIRRHIRTWFWLRWHHRRGQLRALGRLGLRGRHLKVAYSSQGAWRIAASPSLHVALSNAVLRQYGLLVSSDLAAT